MAVGAGAGFSGKLDALKKYVAKLGGKGSAHASKEMQTLGQRLMGRITEKLPGRRRQRE